VADPVPPDPVPPDPVPPDPVPPDPVPPDPVPPDPVPPDPMAGDRVVLVPWLEPVERLGSLPTGWRYDRFGVDDPGLPDSAGEVAFYVPAYSFEPRYTRAIAALPSVRAVQLLTAGYDHALPYLRDGVALANARGVHDASTAELGVGLILASQRELDRDARAMPSGEWLTNPTRALADSTVLIVGAGSIGAALARRLDGFEAQVLVMASRARPGVHGVDELLTLLPEVDIVVLVVPLTDATTGLIGSAELEACRPGALVVNLSRGKVVDTAALTRACGAGAVRAALDVVDPEPLPPDHPLWITPGVLISPHRGGNSAAFLPRAYRLVAGQVARFVTGQPLEHLVRS